MHMEPIASAVAVCVVAMRARPPSVSLHRSVEGCRGGSYPGDRRIP